MENNQQIQEYNKLNNENKPLEQSIDLVNFHVDW